jgi:hypothetical protein
MYEYVHKTRVMKVKQSIMKEDKSTVKIIATLFISRLASLLALVLPPPLHSSSNLHTYLPLSTVSNAIAPMLVPPTMVLSLAPLPRVGLSALVAHHPRAVGVAIAHFSNVAVTIAVGKLSGSVLVDLNK